MSQVKRQSSFSESFNVEKKKLRSNLSEKSLSITCIETLSNELFYEVFEYFDGYDIYKTFSNLNSRFQHLITYSSIPIKIKLCSKAKSELKHCCENVIIPNRHRIRSLYLEDNLLINDFFKYCIIDSSFDRLESFVLNRISIELAMVLLFYLKSLPRLFSLIIDFGTLWDYDLNNIYRMIFSLPSLKYNKLSFSFSFFDDEDKSISVPLADNEQFSTIEYLVINHTCTLNELMSILCHTPQLHHLICDNLIETDSNVTNEQSMTLSNLVYIRINNCHINFDRFEMFMMKVSSQLDVLHIHQEFGKSYIDADRWKRLIIKHMPQLRSFNYKYSEYDYDLYEDTSLDVIINRFTSPFWIDREWIFELEIHNKEISFSIHPYKKTWFDVEEHTENVTYFDRNMNQKLTKHSSIPSRKITNNTSTQFNPTIQLMITGSSSDEQTQSFIDDFKSVFLAVQFTRLNINCEKIPTEILVKIIQLLPNLDSLNVSSLPVMPSDYLFNKDADILYQISLHNKTTKVSLEKMIEIEQVIFLLYICLSMQYFQVDVPDNMDFKMLVRFILMKVNTFIPHLTCLCLNIRNGNDGLVYKLRKLIDTEKLLINYRIKRICNNILLEWNKS